MQVRLITLHHPIAKDLARPTSKDFGGNLALVIGTSNNLYKLRDSEQGEASRINRTIIQAWLEEVGEVKGKLDELALQLKHSQVRAPENALSLQFEVLPNNHVAESLLCVLEKLDQTLVLLDHHTTTQHAIREKYERVAVYFNDRIRTLFQFPYKPNSELRKRLLRLRD